MSSHTNEEATEVAAISDVTTARAEPILEEEPEALALDLGIDLPADPREANEVLIRELLQSRQEAGEYVETVQRVAAEFGNYRKRVERDRTEMVARASQRLIELLLPSLDNFDAAIAYEPQTDAEEKILDGLRGTRQLLIETLEREGLEVVPGVGSRFDPAVHEAVAGDADTGEGDLVVSAELRRGYLLQGKVLRPALVAVAQDGPPTVDGETSE